ncbi:RNA-binding protein 34-like [Oppia nitens]|uniref:RNA-binding protein 34-like n=1 Tax=Oppia nitens TaxID=1686743 RepID=UPI0023DB0610|nr:RNA-binding protein 34-like [Oppia nitens]
MSEMFKCGSIANIINKSDKNQDIDVDQSGENEEKKHKKSMNKFCVNIKNNNNKIIELKKFDVQSNGNEDNNNKNKKNEDNRNNGSVDTDSEDKDKIVNNNKQKRNKKIWKKSLTEKIEKNNERTVFVGNLPKDITIKYLKSIFKNYGSIETIRLRGAVPEKEKMPKKVAVITKSFHPIKDNINAYVVFSKREEAVNALQLNGSELDGHHIRVDLALNAQTHDSSRSIFIGNLPFAVKEDELYETFNDFGDISAVRVIRDSKTGVGKGFGFVTFASKDSVVLVLEKNEFKLRGRLLRVIRSKNESNNNNNKQNLVNKQKADKTKKKRKDITDKSQTQEMGKQNKKMKSIEKSEFEGISAKKLKKTVKKKKEMKAIKQKIIQKKLSQIFTITKM